MANFKINLTEHCIIRFKQRAKNCLKKDNFDLYTTLKQEKEHALLSYTSKNKQTYYYELPNYEGLYFVVDKTTMVCTTIIELSYNKKLELDYATSKD